MLYPLYIELYPNYLDVPSLYMQQTPHTHHADYRIVETKKNSKKSTEIVVNKKPPKTNTKAFRKWFRGALKYNHSLRGVIHGEDSSAKETLDLSLNINPISHWFVHITLSKYLNGYSDSSYRPDFSYSFGYRNWHNDSVSLIYSNYENNQFSPKDNQNRFNFKGGVWDLSYKNAYKGIRYSIGATYKASENQKRLYLNLGKKFLDSALLVNFNLRKDFTYHDTRASLSFKYEAKKHFFISTKLYYYSDVTYQEDYEGDYAFAFGYTFDKPKITLQYSNYYMKTRYPWRNDSKGEKFMDGQISLSWNFRF